MSVSIYSERLGQMAERLDGEWEDPDLAKLAA